MTTARQVALGYLVHPESGTSPGVVMIHDVWGLADHTRDLANRLAAEGFGVLAIDLYRRESDVVIDNPGAWMRGLSDPQVLADLQEGVDLLAAEACCAGQSIGITGFCMGGMYALMGACACSGLSAGVPFYGLLSYSHGLLHDPDGNDPEKKPREPLDYAPELRCPLLGFFGAQDDFVPSEDVHELERRLAKSRQPSEIVLYPDAGHAFMNDTRPEAFRQHDAADAWGRMVAFLKRELRDS